MRRRLQRAGRVERMGDEKLAAGKTGNAMRRLR